MHVLNYEGCNLDDALSAVFAVFLQSLQFNLQGFPLISHQLGLVQNLQITIKFMSTVVSISCKQLCSDSGLVDMQRALQSAFQLNDTMSSSKSALGSLAQVQALSNC